MQRASTSSPRNEHETGIYFTREPSLARRTVFCLPFVFQNRLPAAQVYTDTMVIRYNDSLLDDKVSTLCLLRDLGDPGPAGKGPVEATSCAGWET